MAAEKHIQTVSEITRQIKLSLESKYPRVWIQGEISNLKLHSSGHLYFSLKDEGAQISATMWRSRASSLLFRPEDGMKVVVRGGITVYPPRGNYQIDVDQIQPLGVGELQLAFERLKKKLAAEGLFEAGRKKPIPQYPERIGIITSPTGAAIRDILSVLGRRMPSVEILFAPVRVQGVGAAEEIAEAIRAVNRVGDVDVIIVGRGGGSLEDLWAFNEEIVARAIAASKIPIVSAVGHEIDFTIADFVADLRAPTPSAAAELIVRDRVDVIEDVANFYYTLNELVTRRTIDLRNRVSNLLASYSFNRPVDLVREFSQRLDDNERRLTTLFAHRRERQTERIGAIRQRLVALNPSAVLKRGYAIVRKNNVIVSSARRLKQGDAANIEFHDGTVSTKVENEK
jgi:exodeoxyribonuclease VII large subunit